MAVRSTLTCIRKSASFEKVKKQKIDFNTVRRNPRLLAALAKNLVSIEYKL